MSERGYQQDNTSVRAVTVFFAGLTVAVIGVMIVIRFLIAGFDAGRAEVEQPAFDARSELPPEPRLQERPADDLAELRAREAEQLSTYGWVDREKGIIRIPIERAMELIVAEHEQQDGQE